MFPLSTACYSFALRMARLTPAVTEVSRAKIDNDTKDRKKEKVHFDLRRGRS